MALPKKILKFCSVHRHKFVFVAAVFLVSSLYLLASPIMAQARITAGDSGTSPETDTSTQQQINQVADQVIDILTQAQGAAETVQEGSGFTALSKNLPALRTLVLDTKEFSRQGIEFTTNIQKLNNFVGGFEGKGRKYVELKEKVAQFLELGNAMAEKAENDEDITQAEVRELVGLGLDIKSDIENGVAPVIEAAQQAPGLVDTGRTIVAEDIPQLKQEVEQEMPEFTGQFDFETDNIERVVDQKIEQLKRELEPTKNRGLDLLSELGIIQGSCLVAGAFSGGDSEDEEEEEFDLAQCMEDNFNAWYEQERVQNYLKEDLPAALDKIMNEFTDAQMFEAALQDLKETQAVQNALQEGSIDVQITEVGENRFRFEVTQRSGSIFKLVRSAQAQTGRSCAWLVGSGDESGGFAEQRCSFERQLSPDTDWSVSAATLEDKENGAISSSDTCKSINPETGEVQNTSECPATNLAIDNDNGDGDGDSNGNGNGDGDGNGNGNGNGDGEQDRDGDGIPDSEDPCPADPNTGCTTPGLQGACEGLNPGNSCHLPGGSPGSQQGVCKQSGSILACEQTGSGNGNNEGCTQAGESCTLSNGENGICQEAGLDTFDCVATDEGGNGSSGNGGPGSGGEGEGEFRVPEGGPSTIEEVFQLFVKGVLWLFVFAILASIAGVIFGGIRYTTGGGSADAASTGTKIVIFSLVGVAVILLSFILVNLVASILGVEVPQKIFNSLSGGSN